MTELYGPTDSYKTDRTQRIKPGQHLKRTETNAYAAPPRTDRAEISAQARLVAAARDIPPVRLDKVEAMRQRLNEPGYDVDAEFKAAMNILIEEAL